MLPAEPLPRRYPVHEAEIADMNAWLAAKGI